MGCIPAWRQHRLEYWFGWHDDFRFMAFELLRPTLEDLFAYCGHRFSLKTTLMIADQVLDRIEQLHSHAITHRGIKPSNFLLGSGTNGSIIYVTDFGLANECTMSRAQAKEDDPSRSHLVGTAKFASIRGHQGQAQSPRDDLESLGYILVFLRLGKFPWQGLPVHGRAKKTRAIIEKKILMSAELLCVELYEEFAQYVQEVKDIPKGVRPLYGGFRQKLRRLAKREGVRYDNVHDWKIHRFL